MDEADIKSEIKQQITQAKQYQIKALK